MQGESVTGSTNTYVDWWGAICICDNDKRGAREASGKQHVRDPNESANEEERNTGRTETVSESESEVRPVRRRSLGVEVTSM